RPGPQRHDADSDRLRDRDVPRNSQRLAGPHGAALSAELFLRQGHACGKSDEFAAAANCERDPTPGAADCDDRALAGRPIGTGSDHWRARRPQRSHLETAPQATDRRSLAALSPQGRAVPPLGQRVQHVGVCAYRCAAGDPAQAGRCDDAVWLFLFADPAYLLPDADRLLRPSQVGRHAALYRLAAQSSPGGRGPMLSEMGSAVLTAKKSLLLSPNLFAAAWPADHEHAEPNT